MWVYSWCLLFNKEYYGVLVTMQYLSTLCVYSECSSVRCSEFYSATRLFSPVIDKIALHKQESNADWVGLIQFPDSDTILKSPHAFATTQVWTEVDPKTNNIEI